MKARRTQADARSEYQQALAGWLERTSGGARPEVLLGRRAVQDANRLTALLRYDDGDVQSRYLLGWLRWYRCLALRDEENQAELRAAVMMFAYCFVVGVEPARLPEPLLPLVAEHAAPMAMDLLNAAVAAPDPELLSVAVELWERILEHTAPGDPNHANYLSSLGIALKFRSERTGAAADLDAAVARLTAALELTPSDDPDRAMRSNNLGGVLRIRFEQGGQATDLDQAVRLAQQAVHATSADDRERAGYLNNLALALGRRSKETDNAADADAAIEFLEQAVRAEPASPMFLTNLGDALRTRFERTRQPADLDAAIRMARGAVDAAPAGHPDRGRYLSNLGDALRTRFDGTSTLADLDAAVKQFTEAVEATPAGHPDRAGRLSTLGDALHTRFEWTGRLADSDATVQRLTEAVDATPSGEPSQAARLSLLGNALRARFDRTRALADVNEAVRVGQRAVDATPADDPHRAGRLSNLGNALGTRFRRTQELPDLDAAAAYQEEAVTAAPLDDPSRALFLNNLGNTLRTRFGVTGRSADLDSAIERLTEATDGPSPDPIHLSNLGMTLGTRFDRTARPADLAESIRVGQRAADLTPADHPDLALRLGNLGYALSVRFRQTGAPADREAAVDAWQRALENEGAEPSHRAAVARAIGSVLAPVDPGRAADALEFAVRLLPEITPRRLERPDQQHALVNLSGLASDAAAMALSAPAVPGTQPAARALGLLEAGRALLYSQALETRSDLTDLAEQHPDLAAEFTRLRDALDRSPDDVPEPSAADATPAVRSIVRERQRLADQWSAMLAEIRGRPGFGSFALPPSPAELIHEAGAGPVVVFNISRYRSDALLVTADAITDLPLHGLDSDTVAEQVVAFHTAIATTRTASVTADRVAAQQRLSTILAWLWDQAAGPVLDHLGYDQPDADVEDDQWPRVWWAPGGLLGLLPLHAAGHHGDPADRTRTVLDRVISSYTPTIGALRHARAHSARSSGSEPATDRRALIVAMPTTPGIPGRLHHVPEEIRRIQGCLPDPIVLAEPDPTSPASGPLPTRANVLELLPRCAITHFACHGVSDYNDPSHSHLLLHDHETAPLTVTALSQLRLDRGQLAYLSACESALTLNARLLDEAINLASAFQLAGYPHVIGTLWAINDEVAADLADAFYAALARGGEITIDRAAYALHHAVRTTRDRFAAMPTLWAAHVHAGA